MYAFNPDDLFDVNEDLHAELMTLPGDKGRYLVVDGFYRHPERVRELILSTPYPLWKWREGSGNSVAYYDCRQHIQLPFERAQHAVAALAEQGLKIKCEYGAPYFNTNLFRLLDDQPPNSQPFPHDDGHFLAALVMLNTEAECSGGTAFYRSIDPPIDCMPLDVEENLRVRKAFYAGVRGHKGTRYFLEDWDRYFERQALVEMKFNRLLIYPGILFHGHWQEPGAFRDCWRVNQLIFFDKAQFHPYYHALGRGAAAALGAPAA